MLTRQVRAIVVAAIAASLAYPMSAAIGTDQDHVYRIVGKVRLLFFWVAADDVGSARIAWRGDDRNGAISLLIGSDPARAPRAINEWGYIREHVEGESTTIFGIRTVTDGDSPEDADARRIRADGLAEFGVLCSTVTPADARSRIATVFAPNDATYRDTDRVLDIVERQAQWKLRGTGRPSGVRPGFLTAMDRLMRASAATEGPPTALPSAFVYKDALFDIRPDRVERIALLRATSRAFSDVIRVQIVLTNRKDGSTSSFAIAYGTEGALAGIPVWARYQPNWWFRIELELDDDGEAPPEPANDRSVRHRIAALCGAQSSKLTNSTPD